LIPAEAAFLHANLLIFVDLFFQFLLDLNPLVALR
jgi:hypothetical protein